MANTTHVGFSVTTPLAGTPCSLTAPPRRRRILSRIGAWIFARADTEAGHWGWEIHERHLGLGRRYRDPRFDRRSKPADLAEPESAAGGE
jgi:hypothetical protein